MSTPTPTNTGELRSRLTDLLARTYAMHAAASQLEYLAGLHAHTDRRERLVRWRAAQTRDLLAVLRSSVAHCLVLVRDLDGLKHVEHVEIRELAELPVDGAGKLRSLSNIIDPRAMQNDLLALSRRVAADEQLIAETQERADIANEIYIASLTAGSAEQIAGYLHDQVAVICTDLAKTAQAALR